MRRNDFRKLQALLVTENCKVSDKGSLFLRLIKYGDMKTWENTNSYPRYYTEVGGQRSFTTGDRSS
jgi:hypothetical protein